MGGFYNFRSQKQDSSNILDILIHLSHPLHQLTHHNITIINTFVYEVRMPCQN